MSKIFTHLFFLFLFSIQGIAQNSQVVRGKISDKITNRPIAGANISLLNINLQTLSNQEGDFIISAVPPGRYQLSIKAENYAENIVPEVVIDLSKEKILDLFLLEKVNNLDEILVHPTNAGTLNPTSSRSFTVEETQRFAASFYDPARLVASFPGVSTTNDQGNNISIRGNSPNAMAWRLEGVEIVNPNHLTNAGTITDRPMQNGGGTIILSAQMLGNSQFLTGAFSPEYAGSVSGLFDMRLRKGNDQTREYTIQAGFLGIDLSAEGPFSKKGKASYLLNYRYSFTGLLAKIGVPLGDEKIAYQDISLNINLPTKKLGNFTLFGLYGSSTNDFEINDDSAKVFAKDYSVINFITKMVAIGATHEVSLGKNTSWRTVLALSEKQNDRSELAYSKRQSSYTGPVIDNLANQRLSFSSSINHRFSSKNTLKIGLLITNINDESVHGDLSSSTAPYVAKIKGSLLQPYFNFRTNVFDNLSLNIGLNYQYLTSNATKSIEPRASISYQLNTKNNINFAYSLQGQMQFVSAYGPALATDRNFILGNRNLEFSKAHHFVLNYNKIIGENIKFKTEIFLQNHFDVLTTVQKSPLAGVNLIDEYQLTANLNNKGTAQNKGIELSLEKYFIKNYYFLISSTLYDAKYRGSDSVLINSRFNGKYAVNFTGGKEWKLKNKTNTVFGLNLRGIFQGGFLESPIDFESSRFFQRSLSYNDSKRIFTVKLPDYYRFDLRLSLKKQKTRFTRTLSLDIQNLTNHLNTAYFYYDWAQNKVIEKKQLGMIPVLNYRIEF